jgi:phytoene/squalene synthetase
MTGVYREILERIAAEPARVLEERVALSDEEKHALVRRERRASASV